MTRPRRPSSAHRSTSSHAACGTGSQQFLAFASLIVIFLFFSIASSNFLNYDNVTAILFSTVVIGLLALGTTFVIITGGIDLSIGTGMTLCAVMSGVLIVNWRLPVLVGVLGAVLFGGLIGLVNGFNVSILGIPPFIATLAMMLVCAGPGAGHLRQHADLLQRLAELHAASRRATCSGVNFPNAVLVLAVAIVIAAVLLNKTILGRYTYSIGSNEEATALSGINVRRWKIIIYTLAGLFTGLAGVMISRPARLRPAGDRHGLRAAGDRGRRHRRHVAGRRQGLDRRHHHRRADHRASSTTGCRSCRSRRNGRP